MGAAGGGVWKLAGGKERREREKVTHVIVTATFAPAFLACVQRLRSPDALDDLE